MKKSLITLIAILAFIAIYFCWPKGAKPTAKPVPDEAPVFTRIQTPPERMRTLRSTNLIGLRGVLTNAQDPVFLNQVFPKVRQFFATLDHLGVDPLQGELEPASCSKIRISDIPNGITCMFLIGDGWAAEYMQNDVFSGVTGFWQRGPDDPMRAISHANTNALRRLSESAILMAKPEAWVIANRVADASGIDRSKFEEPDMYEEALFEYRLGIQTVRYLKKGGDPLNGGDYTRGFSLKATSPTTAVLVAYHHLEAWLK